MWPDPSVFEAETDGKVDVFNRDAARELPSLVTSGLPFISVLTAGAYWLTDAVHPFGIQYAVFGTDMLILMI